MFSMTQANRNFSPIGRTVNREGRAVILKNSKPKYLVISIDKFNQTDIEELDRLLNSLNNSKSNKQYDDIVERKLLKAPDGFIIEKIWVRRCSLHDNSSHVIDGSTEYKVYTDDDNKRLLGSYLTLKEAHEHIKKYISQ